MILETQPKAIPWKIEIEFCVITGLEVECKDMPGQALNQMLFHYHPIHIGPSTQEVRLNQGL